MEAGPALARDAVTPLPGTAATALAWRAEGRLQVTVIAKATFALAPDKPMTRTEPQEIIRAEVHHRNNPARSARLTTDLVPRLPRAEVVFTGHAFAPPGQPARVMKVRLAVLDGDRPLLDKRLLIEDTAPFERMPIVYERAAQGVDEQDNPVAVPGNEPNILDPAQPEVPGGFGPISRAWPVRRRLLGDTPRKVLDLPIAEIPDGFDWSYFQAAPADQRLPLLRGDEWIVLEGLHPTVPILRTRLPGVSCHASIHGGAAFGVPQGRILDLRPDTLRIDGDAERCTIVFRQSFPVIDAAALPVLRFRVKVTIAGEPGLDDMAEEDSSENVPTGRHHPWRLLPDVDDPPTALLEIPPAALPVLTPADDADEPTRLRPAPAPSTFSLPDDLPPPAVVLPFQTRAPEAPPDPQPPGLSRPNKPRVRTGTLVLPDTGMPALTALPFVHAGPAPGGLDDDDEDDGGVSTSRLTVADIDTLNARLAPFPLPTPRASPAAPVAPIPGAPWSAAPAEKLPEGDDLFDTLALVNPEPAQPPADAARPPEPRTIGELALLGRLPGAPVPPPASTRAPFVTIPSPDPAPPPASSPVPFVTIPSPVPSPSRASSAGDEIGIAQCATISAQLAEREVPRGEVLGAHGLTDARWSEVEKRWNDALAAEAKGGGRSLMDAYDEAYISAWQAIRGPFEVAAYARLTVAADRGDLAAALDAIKLRRTTWMRLRRWFARRMASEPALAAQVKAALEEQRRTSASSAAKRR